MFARKIDDQLELRLFEPRHAAELFALTDQNREYLREWLPWVDHTRAVSDTEQFLRTALHEFADAKALVLGIWQAGALVGTTGFVSIDAGNRTGEIGYWLAASSQGKGVMTRATRALVDYGFRDLGLQRIVIRCAVGNTKSRAIPERLGFTQEGVLRHAEWLSDRIVDQVVYATLSDEWQRRREETASESSSAAAPEDLT